MEQGPGNGDSDLNWMRSQLQTLGLREDQIEIDSGKLLGAASDAFSKGALSLRLAAGIGDQDNFRDVLSRASLYLQFSARTVEKFATSTSNATAMSVSTDFSEDIAQICSWQSGDIDNVLKWLDKAQEKLEDLKTIHIS